MPVFLIRENKRLKQHSRYKYKKGCMILTGAYAAGDFLLLKSLLPTLHCILHYLRMEGRTGRA